MSSPAKRGIVHRRTGAALALVLALGVFLPLSAQQKKVSTGPRALGVLVLPKPGAPKTQSQTYLIPVTLWYQNRFFDAGLYDARPEPLAIEGGVVYEARRTGEAIGLFTVDGAGQIDKRWFGIGQYRTMADIEAARARSARSSRPPSDEVKDDGPPRLLRREGSSSGSSAGGSNSGSKTAPNSPPPASTPSSQPTTAPSSPSAPSPSSKPDDAPVLKRPAPSAASEPELKRPAPKAADDEDPDRPRLHRAPEGVTQAAAPNVKDIIASHAAAPAAPGAKAVMVPPPQVLVAVSDAKGPTPRPYVYQWNDDEKQRLTRSTLIRANTAIADFLQRQYRMSPPTTPPAPAAKTAAKGARRPVPAAPPKPAEPEPLENMQVRAFDLQYDNYPEIALSGQRTIKVPSAYAIGGVDERTVYVTMVVKVDLVTADQRDVYRVLFSQVTDDRHFDEFPLLTLLDAVDADGNGTGDLLFSAVDSVLDTGNPQQWAFQLYRLGPDKLAKVYDSSGKLE